MYMPSSATSMTGKMLFLIHWKLDFQAIVAVLCLCGSPALVLVYLFYHQSVVTSVTTLCKTGLSLFVSYWFGFLPPADLKQPLKNKKLLVFSVLAARISVENRSFISIMPKVSIIIPIYKAKERLDACLTSCLRQSMEQWEAICVDDGSPDGSGEIIDSFAAKDARFVVIHQENAGVSAARNKGLSVARGNYVTMLDADDELTPDALEKMVQAMEAAPEIDMVAAGYVLLTKSQEIHYPPLVLQCAKRGIHPITSELICSMDGHSCIKLYRLSILLQNGVRYDSRYRMGEDHHFLLRYMFYCKQIHIIDAEVYRYIENQTNSLSLAYNKGTTDISVYKSYAKLMPDVARQIPIDFSTEKRRMWMHALFEKNTHLVTSPLRISMRMGMHRFIPMLGTVIASVGYLFFRTPISCSMSSLWKDMKRTVFSR